MLPATEIDRDVLQTRKWWRRVQRQRVTPHALPNSEKTRTCKVAGCRWGTKKTSCAPGNNCVAGNCKGRDRHVGKK